MNLFEELIDAVKCNDLERAKIAIDSGANVNAEDNKAVEKAVKLGYAEMVKFLIDQGANLEMHLTAGIVITMLSYFAKIDNFNAVNLLLDVGVDINSVNNKGETALMWASWDNNLDMVRLLMERGADAPTIQKKGSTMKFIGYHRDSLTEEVAHLINGFAEQKQLQKEIKDNNHNDDILSF